jgi:ABC-type uncharacterized transport system, permease component
MSIAWLYPLVSLLYALVGWHFWRTRWHGAVVTAPWEPFALLLPLSAHIWLLSVTAITGAGIELGIGNVVSMIAGLTALIYWLSSFHSRMEALNAPLAAMAAIAVLAPLVLPANHLLANTEMLAFRLHLLIALLAYSLFTIAALHATLMSIVEKRLHHVSNTDISMNLPPLLTLESLLFRLLGLGFTLLTLTLITGVLFSEEFPQTGRVQSQDRICPYCPGSFTRFCSADAGYAAGAARSRTLDVGRLRHAAAGLHRQPFRIGNPTASLPCIN